ncbi:MAG: CT_584 family protein [Waddliaceae bacterium]
MIDENHLSQLNSTLKRIFAMPISRSTFREIQNAILTFCPNEKEDSSALFESLVTGELKPAGSLCKKKDPLKKLIDEFTVSVRVAKDVFERGEFISLASSDIITQKDRIAFLNRIRRVDGEEIHFLTDTKGTINLLLHFLGRLQELEKTDAGKEILKNSKQDFTAAKEILEHLITF